MRWLALALIPLMAGCLSCEPLLEVRHCHPEQSTCARDNWSPDAQEVTWTTELAAAWPDVTRLMHRTDEGTHDHDDWDREREQAFWAEFGVTGDQPELFITYEGELYRLRILTCD